MEIMETWKECIFLASICNMTVKKLLIANIGVDQ